MYMQCVAVYVYAYAVCCSVAERNRNLPLQHILCIHTHASQRSPAATQYTHTYVYMQHTAYTHSYIHATHCAVNYNLPT